MKNRLISVLLVCLMAAACIPFASSCAREENTLPAGTTDAEGTENTDKKEVNEPVNSVDLLGKSVLAFGAKGDNETDDTQAIKDAIKACDSCALVFPAGKYLVSESISFTVPVIMAPGAILVAGGAKTVFTFSSTFDAPLSRVFSADASVVLKKNSVSYPEWFGGAADGKTDSTKAIQNAINCFPNGYGRVEFAAGKYVVSDTIKVGDKQSHLTLIGAVRQTREISPCIESKDLSKPVLYLLGASGGNPYDGGLEDVTIENLEFTRASMGKEGSDTILVENTIYTTIRNTGFAHSQNGVRAVNANGLRFYTVHATTGGSIPGKEVRGIFIDGETRGSTGILIDDFIYYAYGSSESTTYGYKDVTKAGAKGGSNGDRRIKNFECSGATDYGIYVSSAGDFACDVSIMEFTMDGIKNTGIYYKGPQSYTWQQLNITNAYCRLDNGSGSAYGVRVNAFGFVHCTNVHVDNANGANGGISIAGSIGSTITSSSFSGSDFSKVISLLNCKDTAITGNTCDKGGTLAVSSCSAVSMTGNVMPAVKVSKTNSQNVVEAADIFG